VETAEIRVYLKALISTGYDDDETMLDTDPPRMTKDCPPLQDVLFQTPQVRYF
jgi:hypothetical protein